LEEAYIVLDKEFKQKVHSIPKIEELRKCFGCATCSSSCPADIKPNQMAKAILLGFEKPTQNIWNCTMCILCTTRCPQDAKPHEFWGELRSFNYTLGNAPKPYYDLSKSVEEKLNPLGSAKEDKLGWLNIRERFYKRLLKTGKLEKEPKHGIFNIKNLTKEKCKTVYFIGCTTSLYARNSGIADSTLRLMMEAGEEPGIIGMEEGCCGYPLLLCGDNQTFRKIAKHNVETLEKMGVEKIVFSCAGCYRTFKKDYKNMFGELNFETFHISELLEKYFKEGVFEKPRERFKTKTTYHDPCELSRACDVIEQPRTILKYFLDSFAEMQNNKESSLCCGGGGLVKLTNSQLSSNIATTRVKQAEDIDAELILSACPSCKLTLTDGVSTLGKKIKVLDITEFVAQKIGLIPEA